MPDATYTVGLEFVTGSYTNVTSDVLRFSVSRGFNTVLRGLGGGSAMVELANDSRKYSPSNSASALYPYVRPQTPVRIQATHSGSTYNLFQGWTRSVALDTKYGARAAVVEAMDALERSSNVTLTTSLMTNIAPASLFTELMSLMAVNSFAADAMASTDQIDFAWYRDRNGVGALKELVDYGRYGAYQDGSGTVQLKNRYYGFAGTAVLSATEAFDVTYVVEDRYAINQARIEAQPRRITTSPQTVAWLREIVSVQASSWTSFWLTYVDPVEISLPTPATSLTSPVTSSDFRSTTQSDGGGTDRTSNLSAYVAMFAETAVCSLYNASGDTTYISKFQIRGYSIQTQPALTAQINNTSSQNVYGKQEFALTSPLMSRREFVQGYAESLVDERRDPLPQLRVSLKNVWPDMLGLEPGNLIALVENETQTNSLLTILNLEHVVVVKDQGLDHTLNLETESAPNAPWLILDHATKGKLDSGNTLAF